MAKARANCTCKTCGKAFEVIAYRTNSREARSYEEWAAENITECDDCKQKRIERERIEANAAAKEEAAENGWPELTGTEKQVAWAAAIRKNLIDFTMSTVCDEVASFFSAAVDDLVSEKTAASWWIDNRNTGRVDTMLRDKARVYKNDPAAQAGSRAEREAAAEAAADTETIAVPEERKHDSIVDIRVTESIVVAEYPKDDDFRAVVKNLEYRWSRENSYWYMNINATTGSADERAAELGNRLLNAGFAIRIQNADTLRAAVEGRYEPRTYRWIGRWGDGLLITWGRDDDLYQKAKSLPHAKYEAPGVAVPATEYQAVLDFARVYGFRVTPRAQAIIDGMTAKTAVVSPAAAKKPVYDEHPIGDVLKGSREVIDDLKDE